MNEGKLFFWREGGEGGLLVEGAMNRILGLLDCLLRQCYILNTLTPIQTLYIGSLSNHSIFIATYYRFAVLHS